MRESAGHARPSASTLPRSFRGAALSQQPVHHNGMWWSRDPSGLIHYYDDRESAWKPWNAEATQVSPRLNGLKDNRAHTRARLLNTAVATLSNPCMSSKTRRRHMAIRRATIRTRNGDCRDRAWMDRGRDSRSVHRPCGKRFPGWCVRTPPQLAFAFHDLSELFPVHLSVVLTAARTPLQSTL